jgi:tyrosine-protein phosphatase 2/3
MLTAESEGGQVKCHSYWKDRQFGPIRLKCLSEKKASLDIDKHRSESTMSPVSSGMSEHTRRRANTTTTLETPAANAQPSQSQTETPFVTIRKFALSHTDHPFAPMREITHLHFPAWPDFGTPAQPAHLLALIELANVMQRAALPVETSSIVGSLKTPDHSPSWYDEAESNPRARPMLVHCSAGCGRTGTFCAVDSVIDMLKRQRQAKHAANHAPRPLDLDGDIMMDDTDGAVSPFTDKQMKWPTVSNNAHRRATAGAEHIDTGFLKDDTVDLIQSTVEDFRTQRLSMVQSLRQFVLCYETILEWAHRINDRGTPHLVAGRARSGSLQQQPRREHIS